MMVPDFLALLQLPWSQGLVTRPNQWDPGFVLRGDAWPGAQTLSRQFTLSWENSFKPAFDRLSKLDLSPVRETQGGGDRFWGMVRLGRNRSEALADIARGLSLLRENGVLVCIGAVDDGAASIEKKCKKELAGFSGSIFKNHQRIFWIHRNGKDFGILDSWKRVGDAAPRDVDGLVSCPAAFGWEKVDKGSSLLAASLPPLHGGKIADFGAGIGWLSIESAGKSTKPVQLVAIEAEWRALECARQNITRHLPEADVEYLWADACDAGQLPQSLETIVMNPPFHTSRAAEPDLGLAFIRSAHQCLGPGGWLYMVANQGLPYQALLGSLFTIHHVEKAGGFQIFHSRKEVDP